jgi:hypothetical protein
MVKEGPLYFNDSAAWKKLYCSLQSDGRLGFSERQDKKQEKTVPGPSQLLRRRQRKKKKKKMMMMMTTTTTTTTTANAVYLGVGGGGGDRSTSLPARW